LDLPQRPAEHLTVQKHQGVQCLVLSAGRDLPLRREVGQELCDLRLAHFQRMAFAVEQDEALGPEDIRFFRSDAIVTDADRVPYGL
jgi:hypothetical protein